MKKRLFYIAAARMPTEKAHGYQIAQMCAAFAASGMEVTLVVPDRKNPITDGIPDYYGVPASFSVLRIPVFDLLSNPFFMSPFFSFFAYGMLLATFALGVRRRLPRFGADEILYFRSPDMAFLLPRHPVAVMELHQWSRAARWQFRLCKKPFLTVALTGYLRSRAIAAGADPSSVIVAHDAVDPGRFSGVPDRDACRDLLGLPRKKRIAGYVGRLRFSGNDKGIFHALDAVRELSRFVSDALFVFVGGPGNAIGAYRAYARSMGVPDSAYRFVGHVPPQRAPYWMRACDALAIPLPPNEFSAHETSPLKLFEYMASGVPIVATDSPALREALGADVARFAPAGDGLGFALALKAIFEDPIDAACRARRAFEEVRERTWDARAASIIRSAEALSPSCT